jgi:hypothetical protein
MLKQQAALFLCLLLLWPLLQAYLVLHRTIMAIQCLVLPQWLLVCVYSA